MFAARGRRSGCGGGSRALDDRQIGAAPLADGGELRVLADVGGEVPATLALGAFGLANFEGDGRVRRSATYFDLRDDEEGCELIGVLRQALVIIAGGGDDDAGFEIGLDGLVIAQLFQLPATPARGR